MEKGYSYWKHPWQKAACLVNAALQLLLLAGTLRDYRQISRAGILSRTALEEYAAKVSILSCMFGAVFVLSVSAVVIGAFCRSRSAARRAEGWLLLGLSFAWSVAALLLPLWEKASSRWIWAGCLGMFLLLGGRLLRKGKTDGDSSPE